jgi:integrase
MARQETRYYYVCSTRPRRWIPLGSDLVVAKREWARLEAGPKNPPLQVEELLHRYIDKRANDLAPNTIRQYRSYANHLGHEFPVPAAELVAHHVALWRDLHHQRARPAYVNGCLALLAGAYRMAGEWGICTHNPGLVSDLQVAPRDRRITDAEFRKIRACSVPWLQIAMDLGYMTMARPSDVRGLRWDHVTPAGIYIRQEKTKHKQIFAMTAELEDVLAEARGRPVVGLYVIADGKGRPISKDRLEKAMRAACEAAGVADTTFRDIRPQAATDAEEQGQDAQPALGHATRSMTERYVRARKTVTVQPGRRKV